MNRSMNRSMMRSVKVLTTAAVVLVVAALVVAVDTSAVVAQTTVPATQNTVTTTGPVTSDTTISVGTIAGQVLMWVASAFSVVVGGFLTRLIIKLASNAGVQGAELLSDKLDRIIVNSLNSAAAAGNQKLTGLGQVQVKNAIVADAVRYTQAHAADTIQALGLDPQSGAAVEAIKARIETAITDPSIPTPKILDPEPTNPLGR